MLENLIYSQKKSLLTKELEAGNVPENAIAFIGDTKEIYTLGLYFGGGYTKEEIDKMFILSKYEFVDLGLPSGLKWATCNVGATKPEDFGLYFAWGETQGYSGITDEKQFSWADYKLCGGSSSTLTKYNNKSSYGAIDTLTTLEQVDDVAYQSDMTCRMPTKADFEELTANTTSTWETLNGVNGRRFTSTNGKSIFVPAAGYCYDGSVSVVGSYGRLWSSSLYESNPRGGWYLNFCSSYMGVSSGGDRRNGLSVRAVQEANTNTKFNPSEVYNRLDNLEAQIGDINAALEEIINGPTFTIIKEVRNKLDGTPTYYKYTFNFKKGMTWGEWVNSGYNTSSYETIGNSIIIGGIGAGKVSFGGITNVKDEEVVVDLNDLIIKNHQYYILIPITGGSN